ncbi:MAG: polysaccharide deacetylase family protein [Ferrimicrobium sp.]
MRRVDAGIAILLGAKIGSHFGPSLLSFWTIAPHCAPWLTGQGAPGSVAITFDDGPDPISTPLFLEALESLDARATFFMLGEAVDRYPWVARAVRDAGHEIGVHGYWHSNHLLRSSRSVRYDLQRALEAIDRATGVRPAFFRPPYGTITRATSAAAHAEGLRLVLWGTWGRDWRKAATGVSVLNDVRYRFRPGVTVLLHDSDATSAPGSFRSTLAALPEVVALARAQSLTLVPMSDHGA